MMSLEQNLRPTSNELKGHYHMDIEALESRFNS